MPQLSDLLGNKKFVKKEYRPWDLSGQGTVDNKSALPVIEQEAPQSHENQVILNNEGNSFIDQKKVSSNNETDNNIDNETGNKEVTYGQQQDNMQVTTRQQQDNKRVTFREQQGNIISNDIDNASDLTYLIDAIKKLSGIQKNIFYYVLTLCSARNALDTGHILSSDLANAANCSIGSAKTSLIRLVEKYLIFRMKGKASRGGHMVLAITSEIQVATLQAQQTMFNPLKANKIGNITGNNDPYSSSIKNNNITIGEEWKKVNFEHLRHIGFSETQLQQLYSCGMTDHTIVQDSINRFAYSLEHNEKVKAYNDPLNVLMGVLRKGQRWIEPNYISPKDLALRQILEEKRKLKEQRDSTINELIAIEFPEWRRKLTQDEIEQIVPEEILKVNLAPAITSALRMHYVDNILIPKLEIIDT